MNLLSIPKLKDFRERLRVHPTKQYANRPLSVIKHIAVHHSLTKTGSAESFARYHVTHNGWPGIGYHFVIEQDGIIKWCHDLAVRSYHVGNSNSKAVGICLTGDFRDKESKPTPAQADSLHRLIRYLMQELKLTPSDVLGHSEFPTYSWKNCPCIDMNELRERLKSSTQSPKQVAPSKKVIYHTQSNISLESIQNQMKEKGYVIFSKDHKPYNLNIVGIRNQNLSSVGFDDLITCFYRYQGQWHFYAFKATTDPGIHYLTNSIQGTGGTAILMPGQYRRSHQIDLHRNKYRALKQVGPMTVARDSNRDDQLNIASMKKVTGLFGINIHRASKVGEPSLVGDWSAGCQVIANPQDFAQFMDLCTKAKNQWGNSFTYTLLDSVNAWS